MAYEMLDWAVSKWSQDGRKEVIIIIINLTL